LGQRELAATQKLAVEAAGLRAVSGRDRPAHAGAADEAELAAGALVDGVLSGAAGEQQRGDGDRGQESWEFHRRPVCVTADPALQPPQLPVGRPAAS